MLKTRVPPEYELNQQDDVVKWAVTHIWQRRTPEPPHVVCALADRVPLRNDRISVPELRTILTLGGVRVVDEGYSNCKRIPVSGRLVPNVFILINPGQLTSMAGYCRFRSRDTTAHCGWRCG